MLRAGAQSAAVAASVVSGTLLNLRNVCAICTVPALVHARHYVSRAKLRRRSHTLTGNSDAHEEARVHNTPPDHIHMAENYISTGATRHIDTSRGLQVRAAAARATHPVANAAGLHLPCHALHITRRKWLGCFNRQRTKAPQHAGMCPETRVHSSMRIIDGSVSSRQVCP